MEASGSPPHKQTEITQKEVMDMGEGNALNYQHEEGRALCGILIDWTLVWDTTIPCPVYLHALASDDHYRCITHMGTLICFCVHGDRFIEKRHKSAKAKPARFS